MCTSTRARSTRTSATPLDGHLSGCSADSVSAMHPKYRRLIIPVALAVLLVIVVISALVG